MVTSDTSFVEEIIIALSVFLTQSHYSQKYETEADVFTLEAMFRAGINPKIFANILSRISNDEVSDKEFKENDYFSSHPPTQNRFDMVEDYRTRFCQARVC